MMIGLEYILKIYNMEQKDLADELGISKQVVNSWIKGRYKISNKHFPKLENIFNVSSECFQKEVDIEKVILYVKKDKIFKEIGEIKDEN